MSNINKHTQQWSREMDDDEDICPTTPTRGVWNKHDQKSEHKASQPQKSRSPIRQSVPSQSSQATMSGVHLPDVADVPGPAANTSAGPIWGMRRRSVNVSGERPNFEVGTAE